MYRPLSLFQAQYERARLPQLSLGFAAEEEGWARDTPPLRPRHLAVAGTRVGVLVYVFGLRLSTCT